MPALAAGVVPSKTPFGGAAVHAVGVATSPDHTNCSARVFAQLRGVLQATPYGVGLPASEGAGVRTDKIYLVGFMTAGKTTVARALSARLSWEALDLDEEIERQERQTVADIFATRGEPAFRQLEREALQRLLPLRHVIVATGGGTFVDPLNRAAILADGCSIWLDTTFTEVVARLPSDGRRPLASSRVQLEALYLARRTSYQLAHVRIETTATPVGAVVEQVLDRLGA